MTLNYILDFAVVVCGILVALLIDRINNTKRKRTRIKNILGVIVSNMKKDLKIINTIQDHLIKNEALIKNMIDGTINESAINNQEKSFCYDFTSSAWKLAIEKRGYNLLKGGDIDYELENDSLLTDIITLYDRTFEGVAAMNSLIDNHLERCWLGKINHYEVDDILKLYKNKWISKSKGENHMDEEDEKFFSVLLKNKNFRSEVAMHYSLIYSYYFSVVETYKIAITNIIKKIEAKYNY